MHVLARIEFMSVFTKELDTAEKTEKKNQPKRRDGSWPFRAVISASLNIIADVLGEVCGDPVCFRALIMIISAWRGAKLHLY